MGKAAIAFGLAGLAAAGVALSIAGAPSAAPVYEASIAEKPCSPGKHDGEVVEVKYKVTVAGETVSRKALKKGDWVETDNRGAAEICLEQGSWECRVRPKTRVRVLPPMKKNMHLWLARGEVKCATPSPGGKEIGTPGQTLVVGRPARSLLAGKKRAGFNAHDGSGSSSSPVVFSLAVGKKRTLVKVRRGAAVVARRGNTRTAVVLGRGQQSLVPAGSDPRSPTKIKLTPAEQRIFQELERSLPKDTDKTPPAVSVRGPRDPSSLRKAAFAFTATESSIFSCALDGSDFRLCTSPQQFKRLRPGRHTFAVKATDPAGNIRLAVYSWTIDGSMIAFTSDRDANYEIYVMDPDGENQVRLTVNPSKDEDPEWSPDRKSIAFNSERDGNSEIYIMNSDGSGQRRVTNHPATDRNPTWSPDGNRIAFESYRDGNREIYVMNADGSGARRLTTDPAEDLDPAWSPDGSSIAFASTRDNGNFEIYVMKADGSKQTRLTMHLAIEFNPAWSPDGKKIAFHSLRSGDYQNIYVMNADGSDVTRVTETKLNDYNPAWAPDGGEIVFQSTRDDYPNSQISQIYVMNADGTDQTRVTESGSNFVPDW